MVKILHNNSWIIFDNPTLYRQLAVCTALFCCGIAPTRAVETSNPHELGDLSLEQLADLKITSVSKLPESLSTAPAAAYVISHEDIIRAGVTSIPEALRLAPGVEVTRKGGRSWSVTIRGFNNSLANKLLVLIDGRSVYSPLYAGVFWDIQDTLLEDIDRIEVISGPGGTLWGANAVNGVINIITRSAADTQGGLMELGGGNEERGFAGIRYGGHIGNGAAARAYFKYFNQDSTRLISGQDADDYSRMYRGGFRVDWDSGSDDSMTLVGNAYSGREQGKFRNTFTLGTLPGADIKDTMKVSGVDLLGRWSRTMSPDSNLSLQIYYDYTHRDIPNTYRETRNTVDVDFQYHFNYSMRHDIVWGTGFRLTGDELDNSLFASFDPDSRTDKTFSFFLQDKINLWNNRVFLTLGSKFEHNDYTGFEFQPNARLTWLISEQQTLWGAVSRAVRIPSRLDTDLRLTLPIDAGIPAYINVTGNNDFDSEELIAYEAGYRIQVRENLTFDASIFYNDYDKLQTAETDVNSFMVISDPPLAYITLSSFLDNKMQGESYGATIESNWKPLPEWRLQFQYAYLDLQMHNKAGSLDGSSHTIEGDSPENQISLHSYIDFPYNLSLYTGVRYVDNLPAQNTDSYAAVDISLIWHPVEKLEISVTGQNLTDRRHLEIGGGNFIERSIYGKVSWRF